MVKIADISLFFTYLKQFLKSLSVIFFQTCHSNRNCFKEGEGQNREEGEIGGKSREEGEKEKLGVGRIELDEQNACASVTQGNARVQAVCYLETSITN